MDGYGRELVTGTGGTGSASGTRCAVAVGPTFGVTGREGFAETDFREETGISGLNNGSLQTTALKPFCFEEAFVGRAH